MTYEPLKRLLDNLESHIDLKHIKQSEKLYDDIIHYRQVERLPVTLRSPLEDYRKAPLEEAFYDPVKMLYSELLESSVHSNYMSVKMKDDSPLMIRSNYGVGIIASLFGCESYILNNEMPWVQHLGKDKAMKALSKGIPDLSTNLGARVIETMEIYHEILKKYPKCYEAIHISQCDLQGPFDILHLIVGNDVFLETIDDPIFVNEMTDLIADTYISFRKKIEPLLTDKCSDDSIFVHGFVTGGKVITKADTAAINLSPLMYEMYEANPTAKIFKAFQDQGGGATHYCGEQRPWHYAKMDVANLRSINYGNPEMHDLQEAYDYWSKKKTAIIGWGYNQPTSFLNSTVSKEIKTGLSLITMVTSSNHGKKVIAHYKESGNFI